MLPIRKNYLLIFIIFLFYPLMAYGHKLNLFTTQVGNKLEVEGFFADGSPCKNCEVMILDLKRKEIGRGKTDERGRFNFDLPQGVEQIKIILSAGEGHLIEKIITLKSLSEEKRVLQKEEDFHKFQEIKNLTKEKKEKNDLSMEEKFNRLESEVKALREEISELKKEMQKFSYRDIIGALGYLLGVFALIYFFKKRHAS